jgi:hypothetical protein
LKGVLKDIDKVGKMFVDDCNIDVDAKVNASKASVLADARQLFMGKDTCYLFYSGHGNDDGSWYLTSKIPHTDLYQREHLSPSELDELWQESRRGKTTSGKLIIISDSCHSGKWATHFEDRPDVIVQASCGPDQECSDYENGSSFTSAWVKMNKFIQSFRQATMLKKVGLELYSMVREISREDFAPILNISINKAKAKTLDFLEIISDNFSLCFASGWAPFEDPLNFYRRHSGFGLF